ncbi:MAG TPA: DNA ligase D [Candidatus Limnocylindrales bacterium]|nr:DNA ligase D [Candidatus Limnocylindrales bacterium]
MPLQEYRRRRDFSKTPEPAGVEGRAGTVVGGRFVVQRHRATRLHYDFRLEVDGVLASWAVPKGPSLDPAQRRMAVHVEDHPLEYFDFEGVIPKGEYGGGDVIVWDWGTWTPDPETSEPVRAIADGELKFSLRGEKLRGRFTIVRTSGRGRTRGAGDGGGRLPFEDDAGDQWLLIHKRDADAEAGWDAEAFPKSVKTGRTNDEVRAAKDAIWISHAPAATAEIDLAAAEARPMPSFIEPMAATLTNRAFDDPDWLFEVKWDGYRIEAVVRDGKARLFTRNGKDGETYFPRLLTPATWINASEAVVDGEVVALDEAGMPDFSLLQEVTGAPSSRLVYQAFDLLYLDGRSLLRVPLEDRKALLRTVLRSGDRRVRFADHVLSEGRAFLEAAARQGLEGVIAKHRRSTYEPGIRSKAWLKIKHRPEQELVVGGFTPGEGAARDLGAVVVGVYEAERRARKLRFAGKVGSGFNAASRRTLRGRLEALAVPDPPFDPPPPRDYKGRWGGDLKGVTWVRPEVVIRAELGGWTRDNLVRQAAYKGLDEGGKPPNEVVRERPVDAASTIEAVEASLPEPGRDDARQAVPGAAARGDVRAFAPATPDELEALAGMKGDGLWRLGGRELKLTNLDKVLFPPKAGDPEPNGARPKRGALPSPVTKRELVAYFASVAPAMLPHLADRALNLHRYPNGADHGVGFWQKNTRDAPSWVRTWREVGVEDRNPNVHVVADQAATLAWLGNLAAFEIHAWTNRIEEPGRPSFALIDIDPGEATTWDETLTLARLYRAALDHLKVRGYPKTTGRRGIQVWIPVEPRYSFRETSDWVEALSRAVGGTVPGLVSWEWAKDRRGGKARLDYTQNASIKTLVAPYAVRPAAGAPVSAPIGWDELDDPGLRSDRWTIRTILARVAERGDLFAAAQADRQTLPPL